MWVMLGLSVLVLATHDDERNRSCSSIYWHCGRSSLHMKSAVPDPRNLSSHANLHAE